MELIIIGSLADMAPAQVHHPTRRNRQWIQQHDRIAINIIFSPRRFDISARVGRVDPRPGQSQIADGNCAKVVPAEGLVVVIALDSGEHRAVLIGNFHSCRTAQQPEIGINCVLSRGNALVIETGPISIDYNAIIGKSRLVAVIIVIEFRFQSYGCSLSQL